MQKKMKAELSEIDSKKSKKEGIEDETLGEDVSIGLRNIMIWIVTIVGTVVAAWFFDLDKGFGKIIFIIIAYAIWKTLHKIFDKK